MSRVLPGTFILLVILVVFGSSLKHPAPCSVEFSIKYGGLFANCRGLNLTKVPHLKGDVTALDLSENVLNLTGRDFINYSDLVYLSLQENRLSKLPSKVFAGCGKLKVLNLKNNNLKYDLNSFPEFVFEPLKDLEVLSISKNVPGITFPDSAIQYLKSLRSLTMDTSSNVTFGAGFENLKNLDILSLSGKEANCGVDLLYNDTFSVFNSTSIQTLDLSFCIHLRKIDLDSFTPFVSLQTLNLSYAHSLGLSGSLRALFGLQNRNMTSIDLEGVKFRQESILTQVSAIQDQLLTKEKLTHVSTICVSHLNLANNHIQFIDLGAMKTSAMYRCVTHLYLRGNAFNLDFDAVSIKDHTVPSNLNLQYVDVSSNQWCGLSSQSSDLDSPMSTNISLQLPESLETFILDGTNTAMYLKKWITVAVNLSNNAKTVSVSLNKDLILQGSVTGLHKLTTLRLEHNGNMSLSESFFDTFPSLENLLMTGARLPKEYFQQESVRLFKKLINLKKLDLSFSNLYYLPQRSYRNNRNLEHLSLANNYFENISFRIEDVPNLKYLDLSFNLIKTLDEDTRTSLDYHFNNQSNFIMRLDDNRLICGCTNIDFVLWFKQTKYILNSGNISCTNENDRLVLFEDINEEELWRECTGKPTFYIVLSLLALLLSAALCSFLVVKHKTQLVVFVHRIFRGVAGLPRREDFQYDVFVGYADHDYRFACRQLREILEDRFGYRVYLHDRDSQLGDSRANSILDAVRSSWKMVLVLSENFVREDWCVYTMHAVALYAVSGLIARRLVVLVDRDNPCRVPDTLLCVVDEDAILPVPRPDDYDSWQHIARLLR